MSRIPTECRRTRNINIGERYFKNIFHTVIIHGELVKRFSAPSFRLTNALSNPQTHATKMAINRPPKGKIIFEARKSTISKKFFPKRVKSESTLYERALGTPNKNISIVKTIVVLCFGHPLSSSK